MNVFNIPPAQYIQNVPMNASINGPATPLLNMFGFSIQAEFTGGAPAGTISLQGSSDMVNKADPNLIQPTNWTTILNSPQTISSTGNFMWNVHDVEYNWVRIVYVDSSGGTSTALLTATFNGKGI